MSEHDQPQETPRIGRRTDAEIKAEAREEMQGEVDARMEEFEKRMEAKFAQQAQQHSADIANVEAVARTAGAIPPLKRTKINTSNDIIRGVAHATGGASHEDVVNEETGEVEPWTPNCPDWVFANYGGTGGSEYIDDPEMFGKPLTEDGRIAEYLFKQAFLNDIKMTQEMLTEAMEAFKERGEVPRLTAPEETDAAELAATAVL